MAGGLPVNGPRGAVFDCLEKLNHRGGAELQVLKAVISLGKDAEFDKSLTMINILSPRVEQVKLYDTSQ